MIRALLIAGLLTGCATPTTVQTKAPAAKSIPHVIYIMVHFPSRVQINTRLRVCTYLIKEAGFPVPCQKVYDGYPRARKYLPWLEPQTEAKPEPAEEASN